MSTSGITIEVDQADLKRVQNKLKDMNKASSKIKNAINRTVTQAMKDIKAGRSQGYTVKAGTFNADIKTQRASAAHLDATIKSTGEVLSLKKNFKTSAPKAGVKVDVTKSGLKALKLSGGGGAAFVAKMSSGHEAIFQREGTERLKIHEQFGNSVPVMVKKIWEGERGGQGDLTEKTRKKLQEEIRKEIAKIM